jgi:hypothetical protein
MSPGELATAATGSTTAAPEAAATLARLLLLTAGVGVLLGLAATVAFGCWMSARFSRVERWLERLDENRNQRPGKS